MAKTELYEMLLGQSIQNDLQTATECTFTFCQKHLGTVLSRFLSTEVSKQIDKL